MKALSTVGSERSAPPGVKPYSRVAKGADGGCLDGPKLADVTVSGDAGPDTGDTASWFRWFALNSYGDSSPVYGAVVASVADDDALLAVVEEAPEDARHPGVLLAAVKFLLATGDGHPLGEHYAEQRTDGVADVFRQFVMSHRSEVVDLMATRRLQTNEIARTAVLAPLVREVQRRVEQPIALIDVGTSAGLNLLLDEVRIDYGHTAIGPNDSPIQLTCRALDAGPPPGPELDIRWRVGLDRAPVDLTAPGDRSWLEACIWPEHTDRAQRLAAAATLQASHPPRLVRGDAVEALMPLIAEAPDDLMLVVVTSWTAVYLSGPQRRDLERTMANACRRVAWVSAEFPNVVRGIEERHPPKTGDSDISKVAIVWFPSDGTPERREFVGWSHNHGHWLDWPLETKSRPV